MKLTLAEHCIRTPRCSLCCRYGSVVCSTKVAHNLTAVCGLDCGVMPHTSGRLGCRRAVADLYDSDDAPMCCCVLCLQVGVLRSVCLCLINLTHSKKNSFTKWQSTSEQFHVLRNPKVCCCIHISLILTHVKPIHTFTLYFLNVYLILYPICA
jgi:hypothetical protein